MISGVLKPTDVGDYVYTAAKNCKVAAQCFSGSNFVLARRSFAFLTFSGNKVSSAGTLVFVTTTVEAFFLPFLLTILFFVIDIRQN